MASLNSFNSILLFSIFLFSLQNLSVSSFEFQAGGTKGWVVPPSNDSNIYNDWASRNRFQQGDTIRFRYNKDSIMEVTEEDYKKCNSSHPNFFSNTGSTLLRLDRPGPFYFISGVSGHCQRGQKMIVKVMYPDETPSGGGGGTTSFAYRAAGFSLGVSELVFVQFILLYVASFLF